MPEINPLRLSWPCPNPTLNVYRGTHEQSLPQTERTSSNNGVDAAKQLMMMMCAIPFVCRARRENELERRLTPRAYLLIDW